MSSPHPADPLQRPFGRSAVYVPTGRESSAYDAYAIRELGVPQATLMENAGRSAALLLDRLYPRGDVVVVAGSGNNGGDGLVLARSLASWSRTVRVVRGTGRPIPRELLHGWTVDAEAPEPGDPAGLQAALLGASLVVDALLGTGVKGAPREGAAAWIRAVNRSGLPVLSLDLPSGVDADTGAVPGEAVRAETTVAFGWPKLGALLHPGRERVGRLVAVEIGFPPPDPGRFPARVVTPGWAAAHRPRRRPVTHKTDVGGLFLLAGSRGLAGAAVFAGRGALRSGVGYLRLASRPENREIVQASVPGAVFVDATDRATVRTAVAASRAVAAGPGLGTDDASAETLRHVLEAEARPTLLDADALNLVARGRAAPLEEIARERPLLVTPHAGEMARLVPESREELSHRRLDVARAAAKRFGCPVLLKGTPSIVASPDGSVLVDGAGSSDLAVAGVGDVLAGSAAAFLTQGAEPAVAGALALHYTGRAARRSSGGPGLVPEDLIEHLAPALLEEGDGWTELDFPFVTFDQDRPR